jgi:hypothetical protein
MRSKLLSKLSTWVIALIVFYVGGLALIVIYSILGRGEKIFASHSIFDARIYVDENPPRLSLAISNSGDVKLEIKEIKVGDITYKLPVEGMLGTTTLEVGQRVTLDIPLQGNFEAGQKYKIKIITDPPSEPKNILDAGATKKYWSYGLSKGKFDAFNLSQPTFTVSLRARSILNQPPECRRIFGQFKCLNLKI